MMFKSSGGCSSCNSSFFSFCKGRADSSCTWVDVKTVNSCVLFVKDWISNVLGCTESTDFTTFKFCIGAEAAGVCRVTRVWSEEESNYLIYCCFPAHRTVTSRCVTRETCLLEDESVPSCILSCIVG